MGERVRTGKYPVEYGYRRSALSRIGCNAGYFFAQKVKENWTKRIGGKRISAIMLFEFFLMNRFLQMNIKIGGNALCMTLLFPKKLC